MFKVHFTHKNKDCTIICDNINDYEDKITIVAEWVNDVLPKENEEPILSDFNELVIFKHCISLIEYIEPLER